MAHNSGAGLQVGPTVGDKALRDKISQALLKAVQLTSDPEALSTIARVCLANEPSCSFSWHGKTCLSWS